MRSYRQITADKLFNFGRWLREPLRQNLAPKLQGHPNIRPNKADIYSITADQDVFNGEQNAKSIKRGQNYGIELTNVLIEDLSHDADSMAKVNKLDSELAAREHTIEVARNEAWSQLQNEGGDGMNMIMGMNWVKPHNDSKTVLQPKTSHIPYIEVDGNMSMSPKMRMDNIVPVDQ